MGLDWTFKSISNENDDEETAVKRIIDQTMNEGKDPVSFAFSCVYVFIVAGRSLNY